LYLTVTPYWLRTHDVQGHLDYVDFILAHWSLPQPGGGWSFFQPPLYYLLAVALWKAVLLVGVTSRETILLVLQFQSLAYDVAFLAVSLLTAQLWFDGADGATSARPARRAQLGALCAALICFWPTSVLHSVRLGNDDLLYALFGASSYYAVRWWLRGKDRDFHLSGGFGALAVLAKSNGLLALAVLGSLWAVRFLKQRRTNPLAHARRMAPSLALFAAAAVVALGRGAAASNGHSPDAIVGNAHGLPADLAVGNRLVNYLWFDAQKFVTTPFMSSVADDQGRQYFWNFALKTSLVGSFEYHEAWLSKIAIVLAVCFVGVTCIFLLGLALTRKADLRVELPAFVTMGILFAGLAALRMAVPMACSTDFRYILPVLTACSYLYVRGIAKLDDRGWKRLGRTGEILGWSFATLSASFVLVLVLRGDG
jgi:hypothetical protein